MIYATALGAQFAVTAGYLGGMRSYLPPRALVLQGSAIAVSALIQTYRPYTQAALANHMPRMHAFMLLNLEPFILIGAVGVVARVGWKINLSATLFFSFLQLGISKYVSIEANVIPTKKQADKLFETFKKELKEGKIDQSEKTLKEILKLRNKNPFLCVALGIKELYAKGVTHFCRNLPKDRNAAIRWYNGIDPTIYRPHPFHYQSPKDWLCREINFLTWNNMYAHLIQTGIKLGVQRDWLKEMPPLPIKRNLYFRDLALTFIPKYYDVLSTEFSNVWEKNYYLYLLKVKNKEEADAYFKKHQEEIDQRIFYQMLVAALELGENANAFHWLMKELETSPESLVCFIEARGSLLLEKLGEKSDFFETFQDQVPFEHKDTFQKIRDYVTSSGIVEGYDEIYEVSD